MGAVEERLGREGVQKPGGEGGWEGRWGRGKGGEERVGPRQARLGREGLQTPWVTAGGRCGEGVEEGSVGREVDEGK